MSNSDNPINGKQFQNQVIEWLKNEYNCSFYDEKEIAIGNPKKSHKFDIVDENNTIAIECKRCTWTEAGNVPSAKLGLCNEAVFFLSFLPDEFDKYLVMLKSTHARRSETLAEYYFRRYSHLLTGVKVAEYDPEKKLLKAIE